MRSATAFGLVALVAFGCGGSIEPTDGAAQSAVTSSDDGVEASGAEEPGDPPCPNKGRPPPRACGSCTTGTVCCAAPEPCAGQCVPDCRAHSRCPRGSCDAADGVCKPDGPPGPPPPPPPPPPSK